MKLFLPATIAFVSLSVLAGCATQAQLDAFRQSEIALQEARQQAFVECSTEPQCSRVWMLARHYVEARSATGIRRADDSVIEAAAPHTFGVAYFRAEKEAGDGVSIIHLRGMCRGMYSSDGGPGWMYASCAEQIREAEMQFRGFIDEAQ
ncbi:hypothetical protein FAZ95_12360 [Trinickia violacea]|uniref:Lysozyme inhibitor LprI N-terminal domain-containing protein n=1 Tax=Trinickia violacea TaxID=2571746 RepID=A0A4P8ILU5_9BURK|nr:hypothetical protein [Trinickia violacea]QCP49898.1 hypothetical protein FAZ95_12360 [Trinickia violacea]